MTTENSRADLCAELSAAQEQHEQWVKEVLNSPNPEVEEDHTKCDFGKWLSSSASDELKALQEFSALEETHRKLHMAYSLIMKTPGLDHLEIETKYYSNLLIERIDKLK